MIRIFSHYVSGKLVFLVGLDVLVLMLAAYGGISFEHSGTGGMIVGSGAVVPPQAGAFTFGVLAVMTSMGLYQVDLWEDVQSILGRLVVAVLVGVVVMLMISYLASLYLQSSLFLGPQAIAITVILALIGSVFVRFAFFKWGNLGALKPRVLVLGTGSRVMKLAEVAQRNRTHVVVGYLALQPSKHYVPLQRVLPVTPGETLLSVVKRHGIDQIVIGVRDRRDGGLPAASGRDGCSRC